MTLQGRARECLADGDCTCSPAKGIIRDLLADIKRLQGENDRLKEGYHTSTTVEFYVHKFGRAGRLPVIDYLPEELIGHQVEVVIRKAASAKEPA